MSPDINLSLTSADRYEHDLLRRARTYLRNASAETRQRLVAEMKRLLDEAGAKAKLRLLPDAPPNGIAPMWQARIRVGRVTHVWELVGDDQSTIADQVWEDLIVGYLATSNKEQENGKVV